MTKEEVMAYLKETPKIIEKAKTDGTKYVVYDPGLSLWSVASFEKGKWVPFIDTHISELNPTHFVTYYGFDVT